MKYDKVSGGLLPQSSMKTYHLQTHTHTHRSTPPTPTTSQAFSPTKGFQIVSLCLFTQVFYIRGRARPHDVRLVVVYSGLVYLDFWAWNQMQRLLAYPLRPILLFIYW